MAAKKFKIKACPLNKKVLQGPLKSQPVEKKPTTVPAPFKLTEPSKKPPTPKKESFQFHAKPIPKSIHEPFKPLPSNKTSTQPNPPKFLQQYDLAKSTQRQQPVKIENKSNNYKPTSTLVEAFSFEERQKAMAKRKEEFVRKVMDEEKKAREFRANPIPKAILTGIKNKCGSSLKNSSSEENLPTFQFKARPAKVLQTSPFVPKKEERPFTEISAFTLNTDRRAKEREEFDSKLKLKEEMIDELKLQRQLDEQRLEEEKRAKMRKETTHKAQPIKKYKEIKIQPSNRVTNPISPKFHYKNKENILS